MPKDPSYDTLNFGKQGGAEWDVGGALNINTGGVLNVEAGGALQIGGVDVTQSVKNVTDPTNPLNVVVGQYLIESAADNIVAHSGGGQALATPIITEVGRVTTVAAPGDSVLLPPSKAGLTCVVTNHGANDMQVYGAGTDTINDVATATGVSQMAGSEVIYVCTTAGAWYANGLGNGYAGSLQTISNVDSLVALAGGAQAGTALSRMLNRVVTVASAGDSGQLPVSVKGSVITVVNAGANSMNVFGQTGDAINALAANAAFALAAGKTAQFYCTAPGRWHSILSA